MLTAVTITFTERPESPVLGVPGLILTPLFIGMPCGLGGFEPVGGSLVKQRRNLGSQEIETTTLLDAKWNRQSLPPT
jgi:hypothetical protein